MKLVRNKIIEHPVGVSRCVLLFSRSPLREGIAKGVPEASVLFAFARRRISKAVRELPGTDLVLVGDPPAPHGARLLPQRGRGFGDRLRNAFADAAALGYQEIVAVPGDVPGLSGGHLAKAFRALDNGPVVLGPSPDGGVWLIGLRRGRGRVEDLFEGVPWRTSRVFAELSRRAPVPVLLVALLDVDRRCDLLALAADGTLDPELRFLVDGILILSERRPEPARCPRTFATRGRSAARAPPPRPPLAA